VSQNFAPCQFARCSCLSLLGDQAPIWSVALKLEKLMTTDSPPLHSEVESQCSNPDCLLGMMKHLLAFFDHSVIQLN
jgi:hypothetical protein